MTSTIFHSSRFEFKGISVPEFDMESGKLIRLCVPNFDLKGNSLVHDFRYRLLSHYEKEIPKVKIAKHSSWPFGDGLFSFLYWGLMLF